MLISPVDREARRRLAALVADRGLPAVAEMAGIDRRTLARALTGATCRRATAIACALTVLIPAGREVST